MTCVVVWDLEMDQVEFFWWVEAGVKAVELRWQLQDVYPRTRYDVCFENELHLAHYPASMGVGA